MNSDLLTYFRTNSFLQTVEENSGPSQNVSDMKTSLLDSVTHVWDYLNSHWLYIAGGIVAIIAGFWIIKRIAAGSEKLMNNRGVDVSLASFIKSLISIGLKVMLIMTVAEMIGFKSTSFVAILGALGLAIGLALQGSLSNFAGGFLVLLFKPYRVGDLITTQGHTGNVKEIQIFNTILLTPENKTVIIPNGPIANGDITNFSKEGLIRVDLQMGIAYDASIKEARTSLMKVMESHPKVLKTPAPFVGVEALGDSSVNLAVRPYCAPADYWDVYFDIYESGKEALDAANIEIPFPQVVLHKS